MCILYKIYNSVTLMKHLAMKDKLKKFMIEYEDVAVICIIFIAVAVGLLPFSLLSHNAEKNDPRESTSEEAIKARSFDYKGHQYILFEENRSFGASSILHNPDCKKCKFAQ